LPAMTRLQNDLTHYSHDLANIVLTVLLSLN